MQYELGPRAWEGYEVPLCREHFFYTATGSFSAAVRAAGSGPASGVEQPFQP